MNDKTVLGASVDLQKIGCLKWPQDKPRLARLSITELQAWYLTQDSRYMVFLGQNEEFKHFIFWNYTIKVKALRFLYRIKRLLQRQHA